MPGVYYLPDGPKNLATLFPSVDFNNVAEYYVQALDGSTIVCTTPINIPVICNPEESLTLHFLNYLNAYDSAFFGKPVIVHDASGSEFIVGLSYPLSKTDTGTERFNVRSNDTYEAKLNCSEKEMAWLQESFDSPKAFIELNGYEGQDDDYLPVVVLNGKFTKQKTVDEFRYEFVIQFKLANENIIIRN